MNRNILKKYSPKARRDFIQAVTDRASRYGLTEENIEPVTVQGDTALIGGRAFPKKVAEQRKRLEERIARHSFDQVMEAVAYTWFNRLVAVRFMELHGYLEHGYRVLSHPSGGGTPEILEHADSVDLPGLDPQQVIDLKLAGDKDARLYRMLLIAQCNALHSAMPFLFERIDDETELLLPDNLLHSDSLIRTLVNEIPEEDWQEVEIIGWLYQFYISEKKDQVIGKVVKSEDIPAATQLFTPNWIVKYLVQNSLGRQWVATYPNSPLKEQMEYYIEPAEQTPEVQEQLKAITPDSLDPEELTLLDPACGSGHILVEAYELLKAIYQERGYPKRDIPRLILTKNLYGLEIDDRAAQLAAFALMMKARADDRRIFAQGIQPQVLSIQESKGLDAKEITEALNAPILETELPPSGELFEELAEDKSPLFTKKTLSVKGDISQADVAHLIDLFEHGKTFGSLIQVPEKLAEKLPAIAQRAENVLAHGGMFEQATVRLMKPQVQQARILASQHDAVVANPPYMGGRKAMTAVLKERLSSDFPNHKADLFAAFVKRANLLCNSRGITSMVTMHSWMFLSSFERMREELLESSTILSMAHFGPRAFTEISGEVVQTTAFSCWKRTVSLYRPSFFRLTEGSAETKQERLRTQTCSYTSLLQQDFLQIPGAVLAYWISPAILTAFAQQPPLESVSKPCQGMTTSDNERFLRYWHEVAYPTIGFDCDSLHSAAESGCKWFPYNKGGAYRKWFGNAEHVVNYWNDGAELKAFHEILNRTSPGGRLKNQDRYFLPAVSWSKVSGSDFAVRYYPPGFIFDVAGSAVFFSTETQSFTFMGFLNSKVAQQFLFALSPTLNFEAEHICKLPVFPQVNGAETLGNNKALAANIADLVEISQADWNSHETSWGFSGSPLVGTTCVSEGMQAWEQQMDRLAQRVRESEAANNEFFIGLFGLEQELSPDVAGDQITLYRPNREDDIQRLISYSIGCMMGRYSLDKPGLIYAHSGGEGFDPSQYQTFPADSDGIIPITEFEWFEDDAANRLEDFIATAWLKDHLEENLKFIAESLGQKKSESARDAIRRYLSTGFYKHHLSLYKKRPIYWLFSSGKQRAFQCLVYLHRYNAGTLSRMRTEYVIPLQGKMESRIDQLKLDIEAASSTSHQKKLTKERDTLVKHREELQTFDEKLRHYADRRITLDLDDGVKVNYGRFGDLLAEVKAITGKEPSS